MTLFSKISANRTWHQVLLTLCSNIPNNFGSIAIDLIASVARCTDTPGQTSLVNFIRLVCGRSALAGHDAPSQDLRNICTHVRKLIFVVFKQIFALSLLRDLNVITVMTSLLTKRLRFYLTAQNYSISTQRLSVCQQGYTLHGCTDCIALP